MSDRNDPPIESFNELMKKLFLPGIIRDIYDPIPPDEWADEMNEKIDTLREIVEDET